MHRNLSINKFRLLPKQMFFSIVSLLLALVIAATIVADTSKKPAAASKTIKPKEIAITFDELPVADPFGKSDRQAVTYLILEALKAHHVKATGFVVGQEIASSFDLLGQWLNDGHTLGSMTYSNQDYNDIEIGMFIREIGMGAEAIEPMLDGFGQKKRYFRFPFLNYGPTPKARKQAEGFAKSRDMVIAHATVVPDDYLYDMTLQKLGKVPDSVERDLMMNEYLNHVFDQLDHAEAQALDIMGRPVKQILRLRANRLNAFFLDDMLTALEDAGYKFITLDAALKDQVYAQTEGYFGTRGVGFLDRLASSDPDLAPAR